MSVQELIIKAIQIEATLKPNEKLIVGEHILTYSELAEILNKKHINKEEKKFINVFIKQAEKLFKDNMEFRNKILELTGSK